MKCSRKYLALLSSLVVAITQATVQEDEYAFEYGHEEGKDEDFEVRYFDIHDNCRDDAYVDCEAVKADGECAPRKHEGGLLSYRELCPVTCGVCAAPKETKVWMDFDCFEYEEAVAVFFSNHNPHVEDFVGIYPSHIHLHQGSDEVEKEALVWMYTCGSMQEACKTASGGLIFGSMGPNEEEDWLLFPFKAGTYKAVLGRATDHSIIAETRIFTVKPEGEVCPQDH